MVERVAALSGSFSEIRRDNLFLSTQGLERAQTSSGGAIEKAMYGAAQYS